MLKQSIKFVRIGAVAITLFGANVGSVAFAADMGMNMGTVMITTPTDGAMLSSMGENKMEYQIKLGAGDDHFHVWIDGERGGPVRDLKGSYTLPKMTPGKHAIIVKIVDKAHVPTGPEKSVFVKVE